MTEPLLSVRFSADYPGKPSVIDDVAFELHEGEAFGLAGESGSGKSTIALALLRLLEWRGGRVRGEIRFDGQDVMRLTDRQLRKLRGRDMALIMQSPSAALNPALRLETQLREAWSIHNATPWRMARSEIRKLLERMGLPADGDFLARFPGQVSVGQAQRVVIAMAVLHNPKLIIADEPTSALDSCSRHEILELLRAHKREHGAALIHISHDLASMEELCDRVAVLDRGRLSITSRGACPRDLPMPHAMPAPELRALRL